MDPIEVGDWITSRPLQLVFLTGLDPTNKVHHSTIINSFRSKGTDRTPLQLRVIEQLEIPKKETKKVRYKGIIRKEWPLKYLQHIPALIVIFIDLDWDHPSWEEKKQEAESKIASIRSSIRSGTRIAVVLIQERTHPISDDFHSERAHELCQVCALNSKQLFVLPTNGEINGYVSKLESAFHELAQGFYHQKLKSIRSRNIPNNSPSLVVRQLFKLAFISELRQDTHTALRNYRLAYENCKETADQWDSIDIFEWRSVTGLLNYKVCDLNFLHSTALEAINQMRKHQARFFSWSPGIYPTPQLASIEHHLWKAKECWHFAQLFENAMMNGLQPMETLFPGTYLDQAANIYSVANSEISSLKQQSSISEPYPSPDPLANDTIFIGQRPWRVGMDGLATADVEAAAVNAITQRLVVNHDGVISLLTAAMAQYKKFGCPRMQKNVMCEMANTCYLSNDIAKAIQLWSLVLRDKELPMIMRKDILHRSTWASYAIANIKDYACCCLQLMSNEYGIESNCEQSFRELIDGKLPSVPFPNDDVTEQHITSYNQIWEKMLTERRFFTIQMSRIDSPFNVIASFLEQPNVEVNSKVALRLEITSTLSNSLRISDIVITCAAKNSIKETEGEGLNTIRLGSSEISSDKPLKKVITMDLRKVRQNQLIMVSKIVLELGDDSSKVFGELEFDEKSINKNVDPSLILGVEMLTVSGVKGGIELENEVNVACLIGEIAECSLPLINVSKNSFKNVKIEFKRNEQQSTEAAGVLFVDRNGTELKGEFEMELHNLLESKQQISLPIRFSAQLVGSYQLILEASYDFLEDGEQVSETSKLRVNVTANEPFSISSGIMNMNAIPMKTLLNHCPHVLNANILSAASVVVTSVEFLLADMVKQCNSDGETNGSIVVEDELVEGEIICYSTVIRVHANEEDTETPLGRLAVEWRRSEPNSSPVRSIIPLCRVPIIQCPVEICAQVKTSPAIVRNPIDICFELISHSMEVIEVIANFDLNDIFMFSGNRKVSLMLLPGEKRRINVIVMAPMAGRLMFPKVTFKSPQVADHLLQQALRTLPATIFVLPKSKESSA